MLVAHPGVHSVSFCCQHSHTVHRQTTQVSSAWVYYKGLCCSTQTHTWSKKKKFSCWQNKFLIVEIMLACFTFLLLWTHISVEFTKNMSQKSMEKCSTPARLHTHDFMVWLSRWILWRKKALGLGNTGKGAPKVTHREVYSNYWEGKQWLCLREMPG